VPRYIDRGISSFPAKFGKAPEKVCLTCSGAKKAMPKVSELEKQYADYGSVPGPDKGLATYSNPEG
jgi:hypothetical protein